MQKNEISPISTTLHQKVPNSRQIKGLLRMLEGNIIEGNISNPIHDIDIEKDFLNRNSFAQKLIPIFEK